MAVKYQVFFCISHKPRVFGGGCCSDYVRESLAEEFKALITKHNLTDTVEVNTSSCLKNCFDGPSVLVLPGRTMYGKVGIAELETIMEQHLKNHKVVQSLVVKPRSSILG